LRQRGAAEIEVSVLQPQLFGRGDIVLDGERRRFGGVEQLDLPGQ
jgi:hypothetical protein